MSPLYNDIATQAELDTNVARRAFNVKDAPYNALGDNSNDDTAEIQAAIDAADALAGGGEVEIPSGTYRLSSALSLPDAVKIRGHGKATTLLCTGNHYAININPGNQCMITDLSIKAETAQASGGGIDFTNAEHNVWVSNIWFGDNLFISLNITPNGIADGIYIIERVRWNGVVDCGTAFNIGDGTNLVTDVYISHAIGTAASITEMDTWVKIQKNSDSVQMADCLFYSGSKGMSAGLSGTGDVTNCKFTNTVFDNQDLQGVNAASCRIMNFANCSVQGCGTSALPGVKVDAAAKGLVWTGGSVNQCRGDGISIASGSTDTLITGASINNNNTSDQAFGSGVTVSANASDWSVVDCSIGNAMPVTAEQQYGILIGGGTSNNYVIKGNRFTANDTLAVLNNSVTGANQIVEGNIPNPLPVVASAATITLPGAPLISVTGTTNITAITAAHSGRVVTLKFAGALTVVKGSTLRINRDFATAADDTITIESDGTNWYEIARSVESRGLKQPVRAAAVVNTTVSGPGATVDGVSMVAGDRMLLPCQTTASQNGVYIWTGAATAATRATDSDTAVKLTDSLLVTVDEGSVNKDSIWTLSTNKPITVGSTSLRFTRIHPAGTATSQPLGIYFAPTSAKLENMPRAQTPFANVAMLTTQIIRVFPMGVIRAGDVIAALNFFVATTASASVTNSWAGIARLSDRAVLAVSATSTATTAANTLKTFTFTSAYTADKDELVVGFVMYQATVPSFHGINQGNAVLLSTTPIMNGTSNTGQTTPIAVAATMTAYTADTEIPYCFAT